MRNRAKCKLCESIIESMHRHDYVTCKCGEISVDGGNDYHRCRAGSWDNFLRVDDEGNEIIPTIVDEEPEPIKDIPSHTPTKKEKIEMLKAMIKSYEELPQMAMGTAITHYDLLSVLLLLSSILEHED